LSGPRDAGVGTADVNSCRCLYPGEVLDDSIDSSSAEGGRDYIVVDGVVILLNNHRACSGVSFVCPGEKEDVVAKGSSPWSYNNCPTEVEWEERRTQRRMENVANSGLRGGHHSRNHHRQLKAIKRPPQHTKVLPASGGDHQNMIKPPSPNIFAKDVSMESSVLVSSSSPSSYVILPSNSEYCRDDRGQRGGS
jgi:hypothetical protein